MSTKRQFHFVVEAGSITGIEDNRFVKTRDGYIGAVKVPGIDIFHFKEIDRNICMRAFGNAVQSAEIATKYVFLGCKPDYSKQITNLAKHEVKQKDEFRKHILSRQRAWLEFYEKKLEERLAFILFFSSDRETIDHYADKFISCLSDAKLNAKVCDRADLITLFHTLLQGGSE